jgi:hypothetical protein
VTADQSGAIAALIAQGWSRAPSARPLAEHNLGEPVLMTRNLQFVIVMQNGETREPTAQEISEW